MEFGEPSNSDCDNNFIVHFQYNTVSVKVDEENLLPLLYTTGCNICCKENDRFTDLDGHIRPPLSKH